jgi:hypothetical protein
MITAAEEIRRIVLASPFLEEGLSRGVMNYSALAREIRPQVRAALRREVSESAILMALRRLSSELGSRSVSQERMLRESGDLTVRSHLSEFTFRRSESILTPLTRLLDELRDSRDLFLTFTQGVFETTVIASASLEPTIREIFRDEPTVSHLTDLSAIVVKLPEEAVSLPGIHYPILRQLAWKGISVLEILSTYTELTIVLERAQVERAFATLLEFLSRGEP